MVSASFHIAENLINDLNGISNSQANFNSYNSKYQINFDPLCKVLNIHTNFNPLIHNVPKFIS